MKPRIAACQMCGRDFIKTTPHSLFCGPGCKKAAFRASRRKSYGKKREAALEEKTREQLPVQCFSCPEKDCIYDKVKDCPHCAGLNQGGADSVITRGTSGAAKAV